MTVSIRASWFVGGLAVLALGCGPGTSTVGGGTTNIYVTGGGGGSGADGGGGGAGGGGGSAVVPCTDADGDSFVGTGDCAGTSPTLFDCDDANTATHPGATETQNTKDDDCDGVVDNHIPGADHDSDGTNFPEDCNDDAPLVGPKGIEVAGDSVDNNCNGQVDEAPPADCDGQATGTAAADFAKAIGICPLATGAPVLTASSFVAGNAAARNIRPKFGSYWTFK
ncbi:MAG: putative metal-binding motif-containing protein [Myxococcaceae bacterium]